MPKNFCDLTDRVAVVIGGTSGLGRTIAIGFAEAGATVIPSGRRQDIVEEVCAQIRSRGDDTLSHAVDVGDRQWLRTAPPKPESSPSPAALPLSGLKPELT